jgi:glyceraldehyde 3-phosphate dehydrogenase
MGSGASGAWSFARRQEFRGHRSGRINDLLDPDYLAYMLKYDSVHGRFNGTVEVDGTTLIVNGKKIRLTAEKDRRR